MTKINRAFRALLLAFLVLSAMVIPASATPTTLVGNTSVESTDDYTYNGQAVAFRYVAQASGTVAKVQTYFTKGSGTNCSAFLSEVAYVVGLYSDSNGHPGSLISATTVYNPAYNQWWGGAGNTWTSGPSVTANTTYWIAVLVPSSTETTTSYACFRDHYQADGPSVTEETSQSVTLTSLPSTWVTGGTYNDFSNMSIYLETAP